MNLKIAICDDEEYYRNYISKIVDNFFTARNITCHIDLYESGESLCEDMENINQYDAVFLDIEMKKMNGMETAHKIREYNESVELVFITVIMDYVFEGYHTHALRYIMKKDIQKLMPNCLEAIIKKKKQYDTKMKMEYDFVGGKKKIVLNEVIYIESDLHKLHFFTSKEMLELYEKLDAVGEALQQRGFVRPHQSFLVNMKYIEKIRNYNIFLESGKTIPVTKARYGEIRDNFLRFKENN